MLKLRPARHNDAATLIDLIRELADYEKLLDQVDATVPELERALFGTRPRVFSDVAEWSEQGKTTIAGFALWFYNFSTFRGRHGIYLEDLFVRREFRGHGIGKALLSNLAKRCIDEELTRLDWAVLNWNTPARQFYRSLGAQALTEWVPHRVTGAALPKLAYPATHAGQAPPQQ